MTIMTKAEFDAATIRIKLPFNPATQVEIHAALGKLEAMVERVTRAKPREAEPALIFVPGPVA